jgi:hypothetical protein
MNCIGYPPTAAQWEQVSGRRDMVAPRTTSVGVQTEPDPPPPYEP